VTPVALRAGGQLLPPLHEQDASVADLSAALFGQLEALDEVLLVPFAVCEAAAAAFRFADAATHRRAVHLRPVERRHLHTPNVTECGEKNGRTLLGCQLGTLKCRTRGRLLAFSVNFRDCEAKEVAAANLIVDHTRQTRFLGGFQKARSAVSQSARSICLDQSNHGISFKKRPLHQLDALFGLNFGRTAP
jgi:hypothetical protein